MSNSQIRTSSKSFAAALLFFFVYVFLGIHSAAAYTPVTRIFDIRDGFSAHIYNITQDPHGVLWMAQDGGGIISFDGKRVQRFDTRNGLPSNSVNQIILSRDNKLWISLADGPPIWKYYDSLGDWHHTKANGFIGSFQIMETLDDDILVATSRGIFVFVNGSWEPWKPAQNPVVTDKNFNHIFQTAAGSVMAVSGAGRLWKLFPNDPVLVFDESHNTEIHMNLFETQDRRLMVSGHKDGLMELQLDGSLRKSEPEASQLPEGAIVSYVYNTHNEKLVIGTWGDGAFIFNKGRLEQVINKKYGLPYGYIESLFEDREGNFYITALMGGLYQVINLSHSKFRNITTADGLWGGIVWKIARNSKGALRVLSHGNFMTDFYPDGSIRKRDLKEIGIEGTMVGIYKETEELTWLYGNGGAYLIDENFKILDKLTAENFPAKNLRTMYRDDKGNLYICTSNKGIVVRDAKGELTVFDERKGMVNRISAMVVDKKGNFIMASSQGIAIHDPRTKKTKIIGSYKSLSLNNLLDVAIDTNGRVWFASPRGVYLMENDRVRRFSTDDGLPNDNIYLVVADKLGSIWVGTSDGVARINQNNKVISFGYNDGMLNPETNSNAGFLDDDGTVWFGTPNGVAGIDSSNIPLNLDPPEIIINGMEVAEAKYGRFDKIIASGESYSLTLPFRQNSLAISYASPYLAWPDSVYFLTRVSGDGSSWSKPSYLRQINFAHLSPDIYKFEVKACNSDNICSLKPASVTVTILPPFYQTLWFRALIGFSLILIILVIYKLRLDSHIRRERELERLVEERTFEIKEMSLRDPLTNLRNRRYVFEIMPEHVPEQIAVLKDKRSSIRNSIGFFMVDIDHFKQINDKYGHDSGDMVLKRFARLLESSLRPQDIICRWGGEEFLIVTSQTSLEHMKTLAERIRKNIASAEFKVTAGRVISLSCSIGFTNLPFYHGSTPLDIKWEDTVSIADMGLYRAKENGRNQWVAVLPGERVPHEYEKKILLTNLDWSLNHGFMKLELE